MANLKTSESKNPWIAGILNFFIPGLGYVYSGKRVVFGVGLLVVWILSLFWYWIIFLQTGLMRLITPLGVLMSLLFAYDAYTDTKRGAGEVAYTKKRSVGTKKMSRRRKSKSLEIDISEGNIFGLFVGLIIGAIVGWVIATIISLIVRSYTLYVLVFAGIILLGAYYGYKKINVTKKGKIRIRG